MINRFNRRPEEVRTKRFAGRPIKKYSKSYSKKELADNYKRQTGKYTEDDFLNPKPGMIDDIWYNLAYFDWAEPKGLLKSFNSVDELIKYLHSDCKD